MPVMATADKRGQDDSARSERSGTSGTMSETSSQRSDAKMLEKHKRAAADEGEEGDLLGQRRSLQEGVFACMATLVRQSAMSSWKFAVLKILLEGLTGFLVVFNPSMAMWEINTNNLVWKVVRWALWRSPVMRLYGYDNYCKLMYLMAAAVWLALAGLIWLTIAMRKAEQSKWLLKAATWLHIVYEAMFVMCYVTFFDFFVFMANCRFTAAVKDHVYFTGVMCLEMPHVLHMSVALVTALVFFTLTALMLVASCQLNPIARGFLASPSAVTRMKILAAKAVFVIVSNDLQSLPKPQAVMVLIAVACICYWNFKTMPFYRPAVCAVWTGMWSAILYTSVLLVVVQFGKNHTAPHRRKMTLNVLYGIFPALLGGMCITWVYCWWTMRPAAKFRNLDPAAKIRKVHKFSDAHEVEVLARVLRVFDVDGVVDEEAAALGETIIKAGMTVFPGCPHLLILYANFLLEVRRDGPSARTQLQLAAKHAPTLIERYQVFCTNEASKRLKESQDGGMDLQAYIEFRRNFRAVLRVHREVLVQQTELWSLCSRSSTLHMAQVDGALNALDAATARAHQVYKRVVERYPTNGKLLRCYGKFLEDGKHDSGAAARVYGEANRQGGGDAIMSLDLSAIQGATDKPEFLTSMSLSDDAVIVINAEGTIMMASQAVQSVFGYAKAELEGTNVALLMPQPFSQRHAGYLSRYVRGGEPHILDSVREVVALHKERYVFPVLLCVTRMSGIGPDSIFLGLLRPVPPDIHNLRAWVAPNGTLLCGDQKFASMLGVGEGELIGRSLASLCAGQEGEVERLMEAGREGAFEAVSAGTVTAELQLRHRYLAAVPVKVTLGLAGTNAQRILVLNCQRTDGDTSSIMVVDTHGKLRFASLDLSQQLNYPVRKLIGMRLAQLLPAPYDAMHAKWLRDPPHTVSPTGCRSGHVVHLLNSTGGAVPMHIKVGAPVTEAAVTNAPTLYVVKVDKAPPEEQLDEKRLVLTADLDGRVRAVNRPDSMLFGFPAADLLGASLCDSVDIFEHWRAANGESQLQLLMLALLAKEQEMPGTSWRVRLHQPPAPGSSVPALPAIAGAQPAEAKQPGTVFTKSISTCMQCELVEAKSKSANPFAVDVSSAPEAGSEEDEGMMVHVVLWRRDTLTGVVELDEDLVIRRASPMTGLIVGLPATALLRKPLSRILNLPPAAGSWEALLASQARSSGPKRSALKASAVAGTVSQPMAFLGPHPDMGTMRIIVQGVASLAPGTGRPKVVAMLHPDTAFVGAHADLMRVLHLDHVARHEEGQAAGHAPANGAQDPASGAVYASGTARDPGSASVANIGSMDRLAHMRSTAFGGLADVEDGDGESEGGQSGSSEDSGRNEDATERATDPDNADAQEQAKLHRTAVSKSDFVANWVRTLTKEGSGISAGAAEQQRRRSQSDGNGLLSRQPSDAASSVVPEVPRGGKSRKVLAMTTVHEDDPLPEHADRLEQRDASYFMRGESGVPDTRMEASRSASSPNAGLRPSMGPTDGQAGGAAAAARNVDGGDKDDKGSEAGDSSADGSAAASGMTGVTGDASSMSEYVVDSRRGRLLKSLTRMMMGPSLADPLERLRLHSYVLVAVMLITHIVCYVVVKNIITKEHGHVYTVHRQALAIDRSQLIMVRAAITPFCLIPGIKPVSVCANSLSFIMGKLAQNIADLETFHQGSYLGFSTLPKKLEANVYDVWTKPHLDVAISLDTQPPKVVTEKAGVWHLGNRYIAAAREMQYYLPKMRDSYVAHRTFQFITNNGMGPLFAGYSASLDLMVTAAWKSVGNLRRTLIILLVLEALVIQLSCSAYQWALVARLERARMGGVLAMLGLPGPVLRQLASRELKILDDSDDEEEDDDASVGGQEEQATGRDEGQKPGAQPQAAASADAPDGSIVLPSQLGRSLLATRAQVSMASDFPKALPGAALALDDTSAEAKGAAADGGDALVAEEPDTRGRSVSAGRRSRRSKKMESGHNVLSFNGKALVMSHSSTIRFMVPFLLWNATVIAIYAVSMVKLQGMQGPLASLNMASHVLYRFNRIRTLSWGVIVTQEPVFKGYIRGILKQELSIFESEYDALMYGGVAKSEFNLTFNHASPASAFESEEFAKEFFYTKRCFLFNQTDCRRPGDPYYEVTHNGLDVMVRRMLTEMRLLSEDADEDAVYTSSRYMFMFRVGGKDLYDALQQAAALFVDYTIAQYDAVAQLHTILLIATIGLLLLYIALVLWPHLARTRGDASRQSALLSTVPPETDVRSHVRGVLRRVAPPKGRKRSQDGQMGEAGGEE